MTSIPFVRDFDFEYAHDFVQKMGTCVAGLTLEVPLLDSLLLEYHETYLRVSPSEQVQPGAVTRRFAASERFQLYG